MKSKTHKEIDEQRVIKGWFSECSTPTASEIIYLSQILVIFVVIITSLYNLSNKNGDNSLWTALLTSCLGYMLPNPKIKTNRLPVEEIHSSA
jgi:hypothetical protein